MTITEDQARLIAKDEAEKAQNRCPLKGVVDRLEAAADRMNHDAKAIQADQHRHNEEHAELMNRIATEVARHSEGFHRQAAINSRVEEDMRRASDEFQKKTSKLEDEDKVLHGRITGIVWWLLGTCVASVGGLIGIIFIIIQLLWSN